MPLPVLQRQVDRWSKQYRASETQHIEAMETLMSWLVANMPEDDGAVSLVHGDYRSGNVIFANDAADQTTHASDKDSLLRHCHSIAESHPGEVSHRSKKLAA